MNLTAPRSMFLKHFIRSAAVALCVALLAPGDPALLAGVKQPQDSGAQEAAPKIPNDQLDSLVAPIALYPDPLLAQVLAASTYPLEIIQLQQFLNKNPNLKDKALEDAVMKQDWDPSVQGLAGLPDVVKRLADDIQWTTDLGNAFLAQQADVMEAVQRMRAKAKGQGNLKSNEQMKVETKVVESKQVIVIEQASPQVVYVPSYNPTVVYGPPVYPYPPVTYPPPGYYAAGMALSFGVGVAMGAMWSGGWGYNCGWGGGNNNITINNNNNFNRNSNISGGNRTNISGGNRGGSGNWQHNPQHRGGTPYSNKATANKYGGTARGSSQAARQQSARQQQSRQQGGGDRGGAGGRGGASGAQAGNRGGAGGAQAGTANRGGAGGAGGGADRVGNRSVSPSTGSGGSRGTSGNAFSGSSGGGSAARTSSSRGSSSMGGGGGGRGGGGGGRRR
jgi:Protein of unknown function (DUF3300)